MTLSIGQPQSTLQAFLKTLQGLQLPAGGGWLHCELGHLLSDTSLAQVAASLVSLRGISHMLLGPAQAAANLGSLCSSYQVPLKYAKVAAEL